MSYESEGCEVYRPSMNPDFVRQVWAKRRKQAGPVRTGTPIKWTAEAKEAIGEMMRAGLSSGQIAAKFNTTTSSICAVVRCSPELRAIGFQTVYARKMRERMLAGGTTP